MEIVVTSINSAIGGLTNMWDQLAPLAPLIAVIIIVQFGMDIIRWTLKMISNGWMTARGADLEARDRDEMQEKYG